MSISLPLQDVPHRHCIASHVYSIMAWTRRLTKTASPARPKVNMIRVCQSILGLVLRQRQRHMHVASLRQDFVFMLPQVPSPPVDIMSMRPLRRTFISLHFRQLSSRGEESVRGERARVSMDDFASLALAARGADGCLVYNACHVYGIATCEQTNV